MLGVNILPKNYLLSQKKVAKLHLKMFYPKNVGTVKKWVVKLRGHCAVATTQFLMPRLGRKRYPFRTWLNRIFFLQKSSCCCANLRSRGISFLVFLPLMMCCLAKRLLLLPLLLPTSWGSSTICHEAGHNLQDFEQQFILMPVALLLKLTFLPKTLRQLHTLDMWR